MTEEFAIGLVVALDRFAKANGLPEINWEEEVGE